MDFIKTVAPNEDLVNEPEIKDNENMSVEEYDDDSIDIKQKYKVCMEREGVQTIIVEKDKFKNDAFFSCKRQNLIRVSRNIFLENKLEVDFCKLK